MLTCIGCGCDDDHACVDDDTGIACHWVSTEPPICSACLEAQATGDQRGVIIECAAVTP